MAVGGFVCVWEDENAGAGGVNEMTSVRFTGETGD